MNRSQRRVAQLAGIRDLRALAEQVAESHAARLARGAREHEMRCQREDERFEHALCEWHVTLSADRFDPAAVSICAQEVSGRDRAKAQSHDELALIEAELAAARRGYNRAQADNHCAQELLTQARRRHLRLREEKILALRDDETAARRARP